jgi:hypothetical protein
MHTIVHLNIAESHAAFIFGMCEAKNMPTIINNFFICRLL